MSGGTLTSGASAAWGASRGGSARKLFVATTCAFVLSTLFDPADLLLGLKIPLFILCWMTGILVVLSRPGVVRIPMPLLIYAALMITIPLCSIALYLLIDGRQPYAGFQLLKAYVFISMMLLLYLTRTNLLPQLSAALTVLAVAVLLVGAAVLMQPALFLPIYAFGDRYGMFSIDNRDYGSGLVLFQMYFVTSPMLAISAAYYFGRAAVPNDRRWLYGFLGFLNLVAMIFAGSRNNLLAAIVLPLALLFLHSRKKLLVGTMIAMASSAGLVLLFDQLTILLNPAEVSNRTKLAILADYGDIFSSPLTLLLGRGLGAYEHWAGRGYFYISELTYLEIFRNFGFIFGSVMLLMLLHPLIYAFVLRRGYPERGVVIGYLVYLLMCISNPNLFSSMGMLIVSVITANIAMHERSLADAVARRQAGRDGGD